MIHTLDSISEDKPVVEESINRPNDFIKSKSFTSPGKESLVGTLTSSKSDNKLFVNSERPRVGSRKSRVETITDDDQNRVDYTFTQTASDENDKLRDSLIFTLGTTTVLAPSRVPNGPESPSHELKDISCLINKKIIFYVTSSRFNNERFKSLKVRESLIKLLETPSVDVDVESLDSIQNEFAIILLSRDRSPQDFQKTLKNSPFYAIPFNKRDTIVTLISMLNVDGYIFNQRASRLIVYDVEKREVITYWGKLALLLNRKNVLKEWKANRMGYSYKQWLLSKFYLN